MFPLSKSCFLSLSLSTNPSLDYNMIHNSTLPILLFKSPKYSSLLYFKFIAAAVSVIPVTCIYVCIYSSNKACSSYIMLIVCMCLGLTLWYSQLVYSSPKDYFSNSQYFLIFCSFW